MTTTENIEMIRRHLLSRRRIIVDTYLAALAETDNPLAQEPRAEIEAAALRVLDATFASTPHTDAGGEPIGISRADNRVPASASTQAALILFDAVSQETTNLAVAHGLDAAAIGQVHRDLHACILGQVTSAALPYTSALLRNISSAHHAERRRIARNLHDHIAHAIALCLQQIELRDLALERDDLPAADQRIAMLRESLKEADDLIHDLASEIGYSQTDIGFMAAVHRMVDLRGTEIVEVTATDVAELEAAAPWIREEFFVAVREAISNALNHAEAGRVNVLVSAGDGMAHVRVRDDGKGLAPDDWDQRSAGKGLGSLRERIALLGGTADVESSPQGGTTIDLHVPLIT